LRCFILGQDPAYIEHFPKSVKRFSDKKCGENKRLEPLVEPSETKTALAAQPMEENILFSYS